MLLVGSQAMRYWDNTWAADRLDKVQDYDIICTKEEFKSLVSSCAKLHKLVEIQFEQGTNKAHAKFLVEGKLQVIEASFIDVKGGLQESDLQIYEWMQNCDPHKEDMTICGYPAIKMMIAYPLVCYIMKMSHKYKKNSVHFNKTRLDLQKFDIVCVPEEFQQMLAFRERLTYNYSHPKLAQGKKTFFTDSVPYQYDHDTIHEAVKMLDRPAYQYYMQDGAEVMCSKEKFFELPEIVRLYGVLEESYVLALERAIIPHQTNCKRAFDIALEKVCTSITSGWFREFAYENYDKVQALYHESFVDKFNKALALGEIAPYKVGVDEGKILPYNSDSKY